MKDSDPDKHRWFSDYISPDLTMLHSIKERIYSGRSKFQSIDIVNTGSFGICLILDGKIQSSEADEFIYHEALVHPAMITHPQPERVFIAGGGEGATLREVLAHKTVKRAVMVDIDEEVVSLCRRFLPSWHQNAFDDPRAELHFVDAREYLDESSDKFDVIIIDLADEEIDTRISTRISKKLKSYDGLTHQAMFTTPKHIRRQLAASKRIITDKQPISAY